MKRITARALLLLAASVSFASEETITFRSGTENVSAFLAKPDGPGPFPAVIVLHEWWGLDAWIKDQARALSKEGYAALAVDLYRGKVTASQQEAHQLMMGTPIDRQTRDLKAAFAWLAERKDVVRTKIASLGFCMGGRNSFTLAIEEPTLAAAIVYYGAPPTDPASIAKIKAPMLGNFGGDDEGPSPAQAREFEAAAKKAGKTFDLKVYEGAPHAFANPNNPWKGYRKDAANDAWMRTTSFLRHYLFAR
ncbi:MAG TPA: dienelactone hydrolase family protein [Vicinamibacteria bacterium]|nr:dienelactone hydrolase family protein [Vicinamibacteria bacterium]